MVKTFTVVTHLCAYACEYKIDFWDDTPCHNQDIHIWKAFLLYEELCEFSNHETLQMLCHSPHMGIYVEACSHGPTCAPWNEKWKNQLNKPK